jgi:hypothetical protein
MMRPAAFIAILLLGACAKPSHYEWGTYEESLYKYYKEPATATAYTEQLALAARAGDATGRTAPGIHAEYGYMLLTAGRRADAITQFETEKRLWPEATVLMDRMIAQANGQPSDKTTAADHPAMPGKPSS